MRHVCCVDLGMQTLERMYTGGKGPDGSFSPRKQSMDPALEEQAQVAGMLITRV